MPTNKISVNASVVNGQVQHFWKLGRNWTVLCFGGAKKVRVEKRKKEVEKTSSPNFVFPQLRQKLQKVHQCIEKLRWANKSLRCTFCENIFLWPSIIRYFTSTDHGGFCHSEKEPGLRESRDIKKVKNFESVNTQAASFCYDLISKTFL